MFILKGENTEKAGHNVKPCPGKMCTLTSVVRSQHAIGQTKLTGPKVEFPYCLGCRICAMYIKSTFH